MMNAAKHFKFPNKYLNSFNTNHYFVVCLLAFLFHRARVIPIFSVVSDFIFKRRVKKVSVFVHIFNSKSIKYLFLYPKLLMIISFFSNLNIAKKKGKQQKLIQHNNSCHKIVCCYFLFSTAVPLHCQTTLAKISFVSLSSLYDIRRGKDATIDIDNFSMELRRDAAEKKECWNNFNLISIFTGLTSGYRIVMVHCFSKEKNVAISIDPHALDIYVFSILLNWQSSE